MDIEVDGAQGIAHVAAEVRRLSADRSILNEMAKEIRHAVPPITDAVRRNAASYLPRRGGLAAWVAKARVVARIRRSQTNAGVTLTDGRNSTKGRADFKGINAGAVRHPWWGNRKHWSPEAVRPGFFDDAITDQGVREFRDAVVRAVDNATAKLPGGAG